MSMLKSVIYLIFFVFLYSMELNVPISISLLITEEALITSAVVDEIVDVITLFSYKKEN